LTEELDQEECLINEPTLLTEANFPVIPDNELTYNYIEQFPFISNISDSFTLSTIPPSYSLSGYDASASSNNQRYPDAASTNISEPKVTSEPPLKKVKIEPTQDYYPITTTQYQDYYQVMNYWPTPPKEYLKDLACHAVREILYGGEVEDFMMWYTLKTKG
jgi:hypothetical protein